MTAPIDTTRRNWTWECGAANDARSCAHMTETPFRARIKGPKGPPCQTGPPNGKLRTITVFSARRSGRRSRNTRLPAGAFNCRES